MIKILLVTAIKENFFDFATEIEKQKDTEIVWTDLGQKALDMVSVSPFDLVVADENLKDMTGLHLATQLLLVNPMVNCSVVSSLDAEQFHEASEGLGLISQLLPKPNAKQAVELLVRLKEIKNLTLTI